MKKIKNLLISKEYMYFDEYEKFNEDFSDFEDKIIDLLKDNKYLHLATRSQIEYNNNHNPYKCYEYYHNIINYLCVQVGSSGINSNVFTKLQPSVTIPLGKNTTELKKKQRGNKGMEVSSEKWESAKPFQTTKIEQKTGIDGEINEMRLYLNKLTDKTFLDI